MAPLQLGTRFTVVPQDTADAGTNPSVIWSLQGPHCASHSKAGYGLCPCPPRKMLAAFTTRPGLLYQELLKKNPSLTPVWGAYAQFQHSPVGNVS
jgi:hypothetical protein